MSGSSGDEDPANRWRRNYDERKRKREEEEANSSVPAGSPPEVGLQGGVSTSMLTPYKPPAAGGDAGGGARSPDRTQQYFPSEEPRMQQEAQHLPGASTQDGQDQWSVPTDDPKSAKERLDEKIAEFESLLEQARDKCLSDEDRQKFISVKEEIKREDQAACTGRTAWLCEQHRQANLALVGKEGKKIDDCEDQLKKLRELVVCTENRIKHIEGKYAEKYRQNRATLGSDIKDRQRELTGRLARAIQRLKPKVESAPAASNYQELWEDFD